MLPILAWYMSTCLGSASASGQLEVCCSDTATLASFWQLHAWYDDVLQVERLPLNSSQNPIELSATHVQKLKEQLKGLDEELHKTPATLEELKQVLNVISTIRSTSMNMELRYVDLEERFRQVEHAMCCGSGSRLYNADNQAYTCTPECLCLTQSQQECEFKSSKDQDMQPPWPECKPCIAFSLVILVYNIHSWL